MNWDQIESKWAAMTRRVGGDLSNNKAKTNDITLRQAALRQTTLRQVTLGQGTAREVTVGQTTIVAQKIKTGADPVNKADVDQQSMPST